MISYLKGSLSPKAELALAAYQCIAQNLESFLKDCGSGQELIQRGFKQDVELAAELNISDCVLTLMDRAYIN